MEFSPAVYLVAPLVVFAGYVMFGISGFGATIIIIPILAHFLPLKFVVPLLVLLDFGAAIMMRANKATDARDNAELRWMLPFMLTGMVAGAYLLKIAPESWLMLGLGLFVAGNAAASLLRKGAVAGGIARVWGAPIALLGGIGSSLFGTGGSVYAIYVTRRIRDPGAMRATMSTIISVSVMVRIVVFSLTGLLIKIELGIAALALMLFMAGGLLLGMRLHSRMNPDQLRRTVYGLLLVSGSSLAIRALSLIL
jgi:uncharacterized membrane protein YfcA